jgi:hyperosmotically inducible protein
MRFSVRVIRVFIFGCLLSGSAAMASAQDSSTPQAAPDNTKVNRGDSSMSKPTAERQNNSHSDLNNTQQIRRSIMTDKSLSTYAHNVKIISQNGMVTLKGPVRSDDEKQKIEDAATQVVGKGNVTSELTVKPKQ